MQDPFKMGVLTSLLRRSVPCKYWALGKFAPLTPPHPLPVRQTSILPRASFRFAVTRDTLASG